MASNAGAVEKYMIASFKVSLLASAIPVTPDRPPSLYYLV
jgi:hypothetical protein